MNNVEKTILAKGLNAVSHMQAVVLLKALGYNYTETQRYEEYPLFAIIEHYQGFTYTRIGEGEEIEKGGKWNVA
jgi:hypothetical protein